MATIIELINSFDHKSKEYDEFLQDLISINGDIPFDTEEIDRAQSAIISTVNSRLNQSHTRHMGLIILDKILTQCSKDILLKYCMLWISKATQVLESVRSSTQELTISCKVIGRLIIQSKDISEIQKQVSMQNVKQLVAAISNLDSERKCGAVYYLIAVLLHQYPEVCERLQVSIRKIILIQVDSTQMSLVNASAKCYALLAKATERSFKPLPTKPGYTGWIYNQALICNSLHAIMDELFSNLVELENVDVWDKLELPSISEENVIHVYSKQKQRFQNLCIFLSTMLCGYGKKNSVLPNDVLRVLCRGLAIQPSNLKERNSLKEQMLYLILPKLHIALFTVLDALISGFKEQMIPFGSTLLQLFHQTLQWTDTVLESQSTVNGNKPFKNVRISIYKCLLSWLMNTNSLSGIETIADEYFSSILKDIVPERDRVLLTIQKTQNLSKRALKRFRDSQYEKSTYLNNGATSKKQFLLDNDICREALITLQNILYSGGCWLKPAFYKALQNIIIPILYECYLSSSESKFYKENSSCRLQLLKLLRAIQMNPHSMTPPPTQYSVEVFEMALNDADLAINHEAKMALAELENILHPSAPTLQLTRVEEIQTEFIANGQDQERVVTSENTITDNSGTTVDEDIIPISNKRLKPNSHPDNRIEFNEESNLIVKSVEKETNQNVKKLDDTTKKDDGMVVNDEHILTNVDSKAPCGEKASGNAISTSTIINTVETESQMDCTILTNENKPNEKGNENIEHMEVSEKNNQNIDHIHTEAKENWKLPPTEESVEEKEILQLFHDKPKDN